MGTKKEHQIITMASIIWLSVYALLIMELVITFILVVPVPRGIRNMIVKLIMKINLYEIFHKPLWFLAIGLVMVFSDSYFQLQRIVERSEQEHDANLEHHSYGGGYHEHIYHDLDKQRSYKAQRNMYLSGFAITLLFVIGRITELMKESIELEEQIQILTIATSTTSGGGGGGGGGGSAEVEMSAIKGKAEKKND